MHAYMKLKFTQVGLVESTPVVLGGVKEGLRNTLEVFNLTVATELYPLNSEFTFCRRTGGSWLRIN